MNDKVMKAVVELAGTVDPSLAKSISNAEKALGGIDLKAIATGAAFTTAALLAVKAFASTSKGLFDLGEKFQLELEPEQQVLN
ncbi:MAG: hypothetical protein PHV37_07465 [Candidatus Gastranaerophilales bacterium]|nr:hypothetical protein [Candidatus Gastranaerophilales bacterium]